MLRICAFGRLRWQSQDGVEHSILGKPAELLALLTVLHLDARAVTRSWLADALFPDTHEANARKLLANIVYRLRRALHGEATHVLANEQTIVLTDVSIDAHDVLVACMRGDGARLAELLPAAREPLLADFDQDWVLAPRAKLHDTLHTELVRRMTQAQLAHDDAQTLAWARHVLSLSPTDEAACIGVMQQLDRAGQTAQALAQFDATAAALRQELDLAPGPELVTLAAALRREQALASSAQAPVFVGRMTERARALRWLEASDSRLLLIEGEPGMGKTALLHEIAEAARWRMWRTGSGKSVELGSPPLLMPFNAALNAVLPAAQSASLLDEALGATTAALIKSILDPAGQQATPDLRAKPLLLDVVLTQALDATVGGIKTLLLLDDVHWAEPTLWEVLPTLVAACTRLPLRLVLSARSTELRGNLTAWQSLQLQETDGALTVLPLAAMGSVDLASLAKAMGKTEVDVPALASASGGNPLVARAWLSGDGAQLQAAGQVFAPRVQALDAATRKAMARAALAGPSISPAVWRAINGDERVPVSILLSQGLIQVVEEGFALSHDLLRTALGDVLSVIERRETHARLAHALMGRVDVAQLAFHHEQGGALLHAAACYCNVADTALQLGASAGAEMALAHATRCAGADHTLGLRLRLLHLRLQLPRGWTQTHESTSLALVNDAEAARDLPTLFGVCLMLVRRFSLLSRFEEMGRVGARAIALAESLQAEDSAILMAAEVAQGRVQAQMQHELNQQDVEQLLRRAERCGAPSPLIAVLLVLVALHHRTDELSVASGYMQRIEAIRQTHPDVQMDVQAHLSLRAMLLASIHSEREQSHGLQMQRVVFARQHGDFQIMRNALHRLIQLSLVMGRNEEAVVFAEQMLAESLRVAATPDDPPVQLSRARLCDSLLENDQTTRADVVMQPLCAWLDRAPQQGLPGFLAWTSRGMLRLKQARYDEALAANDQALAFEMAKGTLVSVPMLMRARMLAKAGRVSEAADFLERARPLIDLVRPSDELNYLHWVDYCVHRTPLSLARCRQAYFEIALRLKSPANRRSALTKRSVTVEVAAEWSRLALPKRIKTKVRAAEGGEVMVDWTLDDGLLDASLAMDKSTLRLHRLKRLTLEANMAGGFASHAQLADALKVTTRTIERDCSTLALQGIVLQTLKHVHNESANAMLPRAERAAT